jgi:hypothetical protein
MQDPPGRRRRLRPGGCARIGRRALFGRLRRSGIGVGRSPSPPRRRTFGRGQRSWQLKRRGQLQVGRGLWVVSRRRGAAQLRIAFGLGVVCEPNPGQFRHEPKSIGRGVSNRHRPVRERNGQPSALPSDRAAHRQLGATQRPGPAPARRGLHLAARHRSGPAQHSPKQLIPRPRCPSSIPCPWFALRASDYRPSPGLPSRRDPRSDCLPTYRWRCWPTRIGPG